MFLCVKGFQSHREEKYTPYQRYVIGADNRVLLGLCLCEKSPQSLLMNDFSVGGEAGGVLLCVGHGLCAVSARCLLLGSAS